MRAAFSSIWRSWKQCGLAVVAALALASCDDQASKCEQAVRHVTFGMIPPGAEGQPSEGERRIMEMVARASIVKCESEGLSDAQAGCILAVKSVDELLALGQCPAIRDNKPSWLIVPATAP
jgi:hypothetical protein